jgi:3-demethoxyubiquinol 3-hydroxylase
VNRTLDYSDRMTSSNWDGWISAVDNALRTVSGAASQARSVPDLPAADTTTMTPQERRLSGALMRVNHVGEVCAQALYEAQALTARSTAVREQMRAASRDEIDHLVWTAGRLQELGDRPSLLNPLWYAGAFTLGWLAGKAGDRWSLGFLAETEWQVERHLAGHLDQLPASDLRSRAIVTQMRSDEAAHAAQAEEAGAASLPAPLPLLMRAAATVMTTVAHRI